MVGHADTQVQQEFEMQIVRGVEDHQLVQLQAALDVMSPEVVHPTRI
jgi:hypothetical protein